MAENARLATFIAVGGQLVQVSATFASGVIIARSLGPANYATLNVIRNLFSTTLALSTLGLDFGLMKYCGMAGPNDPDLRALVRKCRLVICALNVALAALAILLSQPVFARIYTQPDFALMLCLTALALPLAADTGVRGAVYKSFRRIGVYNLATLYAPAFFRIIAVTAVTLSRGGVVAVAAIMPLQALVSFSVLRVWGRIGGSADVTRGAATAETFSLRRVLPFSFWLSAMGIVTSVTRSSDLLILASGYATASAVGSYAALTTISQLVEAFPSAASQALGPEVSRQYHGGNRDGVRRALHDYIRLSMIAASFVFAGIAVYGPRLDLVFGKGFVFDPAICFLLPLGYVLSSVLGETGFSLSMTGRHRAEMLILAGGSVLMLGACYLLIPRYGALGAATASAIGFGATNVVRFAYVSYSLGFVPGRLDDLLPMGFALALAFVSKMLVDIVAPVNLVTTALSCCLYAGLYAALVFGQLMSQNERHAVLRRMPWVRPA